MRRGRVARRARKLTRRAVVAGAALAVLVLASLTLVIVMRLRRDPPPPGGGTCDPVRARGAVPAYHRALLDTIATTEGTFQDDDNDGYDVMFGFHYVDDCAQHPALVHCRGSFCSDAAGRYQFLAATWQRLGHAHFYPEDQDQAAMELIARRGATVPADRALRHDEFVAVMRAASWEWASLPPGRYGQPSVTMDHAWSIYQGFAAGD